MLRELVKQQLRRMIDVQVQLASKTREGLPTNVAIAARWWIAEFSPETNDQAFSVSFQSVCQVLCLDVEAERRRCLDRVDEAWAGAALRGFAAPGFRERARALAAAGVPAPEPRQLTLHFNA